MARSEESPSGERDAGPDAADPARECAQERGLREVLEQKDERATLRWLGAGDPLGLRKRCEGHMRVRAVLLDGERLLYHTMARIAHDGFELDPRAVSERWIAGEIERSIDELIEEDEREEAEGVELAPDDARYRRFALLLGTELRKVRQACIVFQGLPLEQRSAFWALMIDGRPLEVYAAESQRAVAEVRESFERAVIAFGSLGKERGAKAGKPKKRKRGWRDGA